MSDLAGHERYLKTTLYGLTSGAPSCVILVIGANAGVIGMSKEHLAVALALSVPIVVCVTKVSRDPYPICWFFTSLTLDRWIWPHRISSRKRYRRWSKFCVAVVAGGYPIRFVYAVFT